MTQPSLDHALALAAKVARSFTCGDPGLEEEVAQAARIGAWQALERFDPRRGARFESYAARRIAGAIRDVLRHEGHRGMCHVSRSRVLDVASLGALAGEDDRGEPVAFEPEDASPPPWTAVDLADECEAALARLLSQQAAVMRARYLDGGGLPWAEVERRLGLCAGRLMQIHKAALATFAAAGVAEEDSEP